MMESREFQNLNKLSMEDLPEGIGCTLGACVVDIGSARGKTVGHCVRRIESRHLYGWVFHRLHLWRW